MATENRGSSNSASGSRKGNKKRNARKKRNRIILFVAEIFVLAILGVVLYFVLGMTGGASTDENAGVQKVNIDETAISTDPSVKDYMEEIEERTGYEYLQVALFGVDSRVGALTQNTRTDTIIIACINTTTKEVKLVSVYRDTYLNLCGENETYNKCNSAYAVGGPEQAIRMLNRNLDLNITHYVTVGFKGVVETIDALGGIQMEITSAEIGYLNDYQYCIAEDLGIAGYTDVVSPGLQTLNGLQACAYCRIRYTAGDDYRRAERQRDVIAQMVEQAKQEDAATLTTIATNAFSNISTNYDLDEILGLATTANQYTIVGSEGFPFTEYRTAGTIGGKGSCVVPVDLATNVTLLHEFLFGVENYEPSAVVQEYSDRIEADTSPYL